MTTAGSMVIADTKTGVSGRWANGATSMWEQGDLTIGGDTVNTGNGTLKDIGAADMTTIDGSATIWQEGHRAEWDVAGYVHVCDVTLGDQKDATGTLKITSSSFHGGSLVVGNTGHLGR